VSLPTSAILVGRVLHPAAGEGSQALCDERQALSHFEASSMHWADKASAATLATHVHEWANAEIADKMISPKDGGLRKGMQIRTDPQRLGCQAPPRGGYKGIAQCDRACLLSTRRTSEKVSMKLKLLGPFPEVL